jgi:hypothetical protein
MNLPRTDLVNASLSLAIISAAVANYCDHVEHNEIADIGIVREAGAGLRQLGIELSELGGRDPVDLYSNRLAMIEQRNVIHTGESFDGPGAAREASNLRELQVVQLKHDRAYHPDVVGLKKSDQLNHYALHLAKLTGACAEAAEGRLAHDDFLRRRVPDMLLFGIKLSTVASEKLLEVEIVPGRPVVQTLA